MVWNTATTSPKRIPAQRHKNIFKRSEKYQYDIQQMQFKGQGFDSSNPNSTPAAAQRPPSVAVEFGTRRSSGLQSYAPSEHRLSLRVRVGAGLARRGRCVSRQPGARSLAVLEGRIARCAARAPRPVWPTATAARFVSQGVDLAPCPAPCRRGNHVRIRRPPPSRPAIAGLHVIHNHPRARCTTG